jgi:hypothetical protein
MKCKAEYYVGDWGATWTCEKEEGHDGPHEATWDDDVNEFSQRGNCKGQREYSLTLQWTLGKLKK